jgi:ribose 5-phosphate isomerase B
MELLRQLGHTVDDLGSSGEEPVDYPDIAARVSQKVSRDEADRGILISGIGAGMCIAANKFPRIRAVLCQNDTTAELSRRQNDANVLCLSAYFLGENRICRMVEIWLATPFDGGRHSLRLEKISALERQWLCCEQR